MEYLMTYGWAILIVIIVAAALFALGVFNPSTYTGYTATGFATLGAPTEWQYSGSTFNLTLKNQVGQTINVTEITVDNCDTLVPTGGGQEISSGGTYTFGLTNCPSKNSGDSYSVSVTVKYKISGGTMTRTETGTLTGIAV